MYTVGMSRLPKRFLKFVTVDEVTGCHNWTGTRTKGYGVLRLPGSRRYHRAHKVALLGPWTTYPEGTRLIRHLCNNKGCVNPAHLRLGTDRENHADRVADATAYTAAGEDHGNTRLTNKEVAALWNEYWAGGTTYQQLAKKYDIAKCTVSHIISGRSWTSVTDLLPRPPEEHPRVNNLRNAVRKLTNSQVREIRQRYAEGGVTQAELGEEYGVHQVTIGKIIREERY